MDEKSKQKQIKNSLRYMMVMGASSLAPLITLPIFTRILTKEDFGILILAEIYAVLITGVIFMGLNVIYDCNFFKYKNDVKKFSQLLYSILIFVFCNFFIFAGLTYFWKFSISRLIFRSTLYGNIIFYYLCATFFDRLSEFYFSYFKNLEDAKSYLKYSMTLIVFNLVLSIYMVVFLRMGISGWVYAKLLSALVLCLMLTYQLLLRLPLSFNKEILTESFKMGCPLVPNSLLKVAGMKIDKYMINLLASLGGVGVYGIGQRISYLSFSFMTALENVFQPHIYKQMFDSKESEQAIGKYLMPFVYISIFVVLLIALFSEEVVSILTPPSYHGVSDIVAILSMYYGFLFFSKLATLQFVFAKKTHISAVLLISSYILNIAVNIPFILKWGAVGAAWATLLVGIVTGTVMILIAQRHYFIKWRYDQLSAIFITAFAFTMALIILRNFSYDYVTRMVVKCIALGVYFYIGVRINVISMGNFYFIKNIITHRWYKSLQT